MFGVSSRLSLMTDGSLTNAALGAESGLVVEVTQRIPSPATALAASQPAGSAGAVTPSKFSEKLAQGVGVEVVGVTVADEDAVERTHGVRA